MKKLIVIFLAILLNFNNFAFASSYLDNQLEASKKNKKYSSVKKYTWQYNKKENKGNENIKIKDPKLLSLKEIKPINKKLYNKKVKEDEKAYNSKAFSNLKQQTNSINVNPFPVDFYNLYRISEQIIRANNLDYVNWRIAINKDAEDFNAGTTAANLVVINTALYDSLCTNPDALAFIISHEFAHQILGHAQQMTDMEHRNNKIEYALLPLAFFGLNPENITDSMENKASRKLEYIADSLSIELLTRAGYDTNKALEAVNIMNAIAHKETVHSTHPAPEKRIKNIEETQKYLSPYLKDEGKINIYNSDVLECKKSSDRVSFVIFQSKNKDDNTFYELETPEEVLTRIAYIDYKNGNMKSAIKAFKKLAEISDSAIPYLYISYSFEYLYRQENKEKYLNRAIKNAQKAQMLEPKNEFVKKQLEELTEKL